MWLKLGSSSLAFQPEKIRLNSKLSVKIVRKQVYERTESSFAYADFLVLCFYICSYSKLFLSHLSLYAVVLIAPCLISSHPSAPLGVLLSIDTKVPKKSLFGTPHLETEFPFCGGKRKISASDAAKGRRF